VTAKRDGARYQKQLVELEPKSRRVFRHRPNTSVQFDASNVRTDSNGLRGPERARPKPEGVKRILFLGDSITLGMGVEENETFVECTARALAGATGETWEGVNAGHLMYDTRQELATLEEIGFGYEPDVVVLVYTNNDVVSTRKTYEKVRESPREMTAEAQEFLAMSRRLGRIRPYLPNLFSLLHMSLKLANPGGQMGSLEGAEAIGLSLEEGWNASREALLKMREECGERGIPFAVVTFERAGWAVPRVLELCKARSIPCTPIGFLDEEYRQGLQISKADPHPNARGHAILTRNLLAYLRESGMIPGLRQ
jgi:lysophospholipase L1-like esterase